MPRTIRQGVTGEDVKALNQFFKALGYGTGVSDYFGATTSAAVKKFQAASKLKADGIVGNQTWSKLQAMGLKVPVVAGTTSVYTPEIQDLAPPLPTVEGWMGIPYLYWGVGVVAVTALAVYLSTRET